MGAADADVVRGTLDMLILRALSLAPLHGWGITQRIEQVTAGVLQVNPGSLYPALERLQDRGWIVAEWGTTENNRKAKYYSITETGREQLGQETAGWNRLVAAIDTFLRTA